MRVWSIFQFKVIIILNVIAMLDIHFKVAVPTAKEVYQSLKI